MAKAGQAINMYEALPQEILPGPNLNAEQSQTYLRDIIIQTIPSSDVRNLNTDLKWKFLLNRHMFEKKKKLNRKKTFLTRKQRVEMNLLKLPKEGWNYASLEPLRNMWKEYMRQNLEVTKAPECTDPEWAAFSAVLAKSELVGADMTVVKSKVPNQIGITGTVVLETKMTFQIITPQSKLKTLVKDSSVFQFRLDAMLFTVYGKHLMTRPGDRSSKKIRLKMDLDL